MAKLPETARVYAYATENIGNASLVNMINNK
jgi:hypothetical protein